MGYAILWLSSLAAGLLFVATVAAFGASRKRRARQLELPIAAAIFPFLAGVTGTTYAAYLLSIPISRNWFAYSLSRTLLFTAGAVLLIVFGMRRRGEPEARPRALNWPRGKLAAGLATSVAVYVVTIAYMDVVMRLELVNLAAEARAMALSVAPPRVPDHRNAAFVYEQAFEVMGDLKTWRRIHRKWLCAVEEPDFDPTKDEPQRLLRENTDALQLLRRAASMPDFYFETDYAQPLSMRVPELMRWRNASNLLALDARNRAAKGDVQGAVEDIGAIWNMAGHLSTAPGLISCMIAAAIDSTGSRALENVLGHGAAGAGDLMGVSTRPQVSFLNAHARAWRMEEAWHLSLFASSSGSLVAGSAQALSLFLPEGTVWRVYMLPADLTAHRYRMEQTQSLATKPFCEAQEQAKGLEAKFLEDKGGLITARGMLDLLPGMHVAAEAEALHRLALLALAATAYKAEHGAYPRELADLVPDYIEAVPIDPFDGKPLRMLAVDGGLVLYSVYENGRDDGGEEKVRRASEWDGDLTFCLGKAYEERRLRPALERAEKLKSCEGVRGSPRRR